MIATVLISFAAVGFFYLVVRRSAAAFVWSFVAVTHLLSVMFDPTLQAIGTVLRLVSWLFVLFYALSISKPLHTARTPGQRLFVGMIVAFLILGTISILWTVNLSDTAAKVAAFMLATSALIMTSNRRWSQSFDSLLSDLAVVVNTTSFAIALSYGMTAVGMVPAAGIGAGGRFQGLFQNPNTPATIAAVLLLLSLWIARRRRRVLAYCPPLVLLSAILVSSSRGAMLACLVAGLIVFSISLVKRPRVGGIIVGGLILGLLLMHERVLEFLAGLDPASPNVFARLLSDDRLNSVLNGRDVAWRTGFELFLDRPIAGRGWNATRTVLGDAYMAGQSNFSLGQAHSSYVEVLVDSGLLGAILLGVALVALSVRSIALIPRAWGISASVFAGLVVSASESMMFGLSSVAAVTFWMAAFAAFSPALDRDKQDADLAPEHTATYGR